MNDDVLTEILVRLPVQSLLRFRAVCKFWGDVIDSPQFRKLHTHKNNSNKSDDMVYLELTPRRKLFLQGSFPNFGNKKLLMKSDHFNGYPKSYWPCRDLVGAVKVGLICINPDNVKVPIAICNPFLGQVKILPPTSCGYSREVAIGFDEDYKVVQLMSCSQHRRLHAQLYTRRTDSWRELGGEGSVLDGLEFYSFSPIESRCRNGYFAHWHVFKAGEDTASDILCSHILSFDMKNEVFRTIRLPEDYIKTRSWIFAEDEHSFRRFDIPVFESDKMVVRIYESRNEGSELSWSHVVNVKVPLRGVPPTKWKIRCVFFQHGYVYDYRAHKFLPKHSVCPYWEDSVEYRGSFVSP